MTQDSKNNELLQQKAEAMKLALQNNPCGICRANGAPFCKGHSGKRGTSHFQEQLAAIADTEVKVQTEVEANCWSQEGSAFQFNNEHAFYVIRSEMKAGKLIFDVEKTLSPEEHKILEDYIYKIKTECQQFFQSTELKEAEEYTLNKTLDQNNNLHLILSFSKPAYCKSFIHYLLDKNYLPEPSAALELQVKNE